MNQTDMRLIEAGFPCHQVGAETQRERGASSALPPLYYLHVWWARRPLTPSRAAILASLLPADTDPDWFLRQLGIEKVQALVDGVPWTLTEDTHFKRITNKGGEEIFTVDRFAINWIKKEQERRAENWNIIAEMIAKDPSLANDPVTIRWQEDSKAFPLPLPEKDDELPVRRIAADPAHVNERIAFAKSDRVKKALGGELRWDKPDLYAYDRAYTHHPIPAEKPLVVLDPTAGGGSIPFEALRLGHKVIANDLNPVATVIQYATLDYPARFGPSLADDIQKWGLQLVEPVAKEMADLTPFSPLPESERERLRDHCKKCPNVISLFDKSEIHQTGLLYARQVTCPHCGGEAPLFNSCWLSKADGDEWGVSVLSDGKANGGKVTFKTYRCVNGKGPNGEDPEFATVYRGEGTCTHCKQKIDGDEIKKQARGESEFGKWQERLFCVVAVRRQPRLDKQGQPLRDSEQEIKVIGHTPASSRGAGRRAK